MKRANAWAVLAIVGWSLAGCGKGGNGGPTAAEAPDAQHMEKVVGLWQEYHNATRKVPNSAKDLKDYFSGKSDALSKLTITNLDEALTSPRDHQQYVINAPSGVGRGQVMGIIAYEKTGVNGKRMTVTNTGTISELTDKELSDALGKAPK